MAVAYRSSSTANTGATAAGSLQINMPAGVQVGDSLFASISTDGVPVVNAPSDWTLIKSVASGAASNSKLFVYFRQATGYESSSYTWSLSASTKQMSGLIIAYSGASGFSPTWFGTNGNTTASTTLTNVSVNNTWSGMNVTFWGTRNATGSSTITPPNGSWFVRADTCTSASPFIEAEVQDIVQALPVNTISGASAPSTASQSDTSESINIAIDDAHQTVPLCIDDIFKVTWTTAQTTANNTIYTNYPNELVIACITVEVGASITVSSVTATGLTFTKLSGGTINTQGGDCEIWYALAPTPQAATVVTVTFTSNSAGLFTTFGVSGIDLTSGDGTSAFGAIATANAASSSTAQASVITTRNNSWVFAIANSSNSNKLGTSGPISGQMALTQHNNSTTSSAYVIANNTATATSGTSVNMSSLSATVTDWNMITFEILPSFGHGLSAGGVGS